MVKVDLDFWNERWERGETGFHQAEINPYLSFYYGIKGPGHGQRLQYRVFVPLCGKSLDMRWLSLNGYAVVGVECSELAVKTFFKEHDLAYEKIEYENYIKYIYRGTDNDRDIEILVGNFFELKQSDLGVVTDIYDRASLIALPGDMRQQYAEKIIELQQAGTRTLLITLHYDQEEMNGPPFSVSENEVDSLYKNKFEIIKLAEKNIIDDEDRFKQRGLTGLIETAYKLTCI